jgi:hypothetical protein
MEILAPFQPRIKGGGVITVKGEAPGQAIFFELVSIDPESGEEGPAWGSLRWPLRRTDGSSLATNIYLAPIDPAYAGGIDRVKVRRGG